MSNKTASPILSRENTRKFINQVDLACRLMDVEVLRSVVEKFNLLEWEDSLEFLEDAKDKLEFWKKPEQLIQLKQVENFDTRCMACVFGKTVKGYEVTYYEELKSGSVIHYARYFAVNFEKCEEQLTDFAWCNAFLKGDEMKELQ